VTFLAGFYQGSTSIQSLKPIYLNETTADILWKEDVPEYVGGREKGTDGFGRGRRKEEVYVGDRESEVGTAQMIFRGMEEERGMGVAPEGLGVSG
jgi:hypothetical protein